MSSTNGVETFDVHNGEKGASNYNLYNFSLSVNIEISTFSERDKVV